MTHLMMVDPPSAGDDLGIPGSTVAYRHGARLGQRARGDGTAWEGKEGGGDEVVNHKRSQMQVDEPAGFLMTQLVAPWRSAWT